MSRYSFEKISDEEFDKFSEKHPLTSFHQTAEWGKVKLSNGWKYVCLGLKKDGKIIASTLLLSKNVFHGKKAFYSPRGFLIDFNDKKVLQEFTNGIKEYAKKENGIFVKIDPYISYQERDIDANIVKNGENNYKAHQNLISLGFKHHGFTLEQEDLQPRWIFVTETKGKNLDEIRHNMTQKTRQKLNGNEKLCIKNREIGRDEIKKYKEVMESTAERRGFIDRPLSYYEKIYDEFHDKGWAKYVLAEVDVKELINNYQKEADDIRAKIAAREKQFKSGKQKMSEQNYTAKKAADEKSLAKIEEKIDKAHKNFKHDTEVLGGILFFTFGHEVLSLFGGAYEDFADFQSAYTTHYWGLKYAVENGFDRYNFYGIEGVFDEKHPMYGLYKFKRGYDGKVVELVGEYDLVLKPFWNFMYKTAFKFYHFVKNFGRKK